MSAGLVLTTGAAVAGGYALARRVGPEGRIDRALMVGTFTSAWCVLATGAAGVFGVLEPLTLAALTAAVATVLWVIAPAPESLRTTLQRWQGDLAAARSHPWAVVLVALAVAAVAWQVVVALVLAPFAFDGISYHLTIVSDWVQSGDLARSDLSLCCAAYPLGPDLLFAWVTTLDGSTAPVDLVQLPHVLLGAAAVAGLARSAGTSRSGAVVAAAIFTTTPIVLVQAPTNMVDVIVVAWTLAALHWLVRYAVTGDRHRLVLVALAAGLVLGTKGTGILWAAVLIVVTSACVVWRSRRDGSTTASALRSVGGLLLVAGVAGGPWYVHNWVVDGNPLHPFAVEAGGVTFFDGPLAVGEVLTVPPGGVDEPAVESIARSWASDLAVWAQGSYDYQQRSGGLGPVFVWLGLPAGAFWVARAVTRRSPLLWAVGATAAVFAVQPYRWWSRFTIPLAAFAAIAIVVVIAASPRPLRRVLQGATVAACLAGVVLSSHEVDPAARADPIAASEVLELMGEDADVRSVGAVFHEEYGFVDDMPADARVVVDLAADPVRFVSPLFGRELTRSVEPLVGDDPPPGRWIVTGTGRPVDRVLEEDPGWVLVSDVDDLRVWKPR